MTPEENLVKQSWGKCVWTNIHVTVTWRSSGGNTDRRIVRIYWITILSLSHFRDNLTLINKTITSWNLEVSVFEEQRCQHCIASSSCFFGHFSPIVLRFNHCMHTEVHIRHVICAYMHVLHVQWRSYGMLSNRRLFQPSVNIIDPPVLHGMKILDR
jgi:hypothetical protein